MGNLFKFVVVYVFFRFVVVGRWDFFGRCVSSCFFSFKIVCVIMGMIFLCLYMIFFKMFVNFFLFFMFLIGGKL